MSHQSITVTWAANFAAVQRISPAAAEALRVSAFLDPDAIPFELFSRGAPHLGEPIALAISDGGELAVAELLVPLARYSLLRYDAETQTFGVHRLVLEIVRSAIAQPLRVMYAERAIAALEPSFRKATTAIGRSAIGSSLTRHRHPLGLKPRAPHRNARCAS